MKWILRYLSGSLIYVWRWGEIIIFWLVSWTLTMPENLIEKTIHRIYFVLAVVLLAGRHYNNIIYHGAKYMDMAKSVKEVLWLKGLFDEHSLCQM